MEKLIIAALLSAFISSPALADENSGQYYAEAKLGNAWGVIGGCMIDQNFAEEIEYIDLGSSGNYKSRAIGISGVYLHPIKQQVSLIGKLGIARTTSDYSGTGAGYTLINTSLSFSVGAQYAFNTQAAVQAGFQSYSLASGAGNAQSAYVAGVYKF